MEVQNDIRWKQRFSNFKKTICLLQNALNIEAPDVVQRAGIIRFFEMSFELAWKTTKDFLNNEGFQEINSPRSVIKNAFQLGIIEDGENWMKCLESRNKMTLIYDEETSVSIENSIRNTYVKLLSDLVAFYEKHL